MENISDEELKKISEKVMSKSSSADTINYLIEKMEPNALLNANTNPKKPPKYNYTTLGFSVINNQIELAKVLLEKGGDPNYVVKSTGQTSTHLLALHLYSMNNADKWIELFAKYNADFDKESENKLKVTPLEQMSDKEKEIYNKVISNLPQNKSKMQ